MKFQSPKEIYDCARQRARLKHYSLRTEQAYLQWIQRFIRFHKRSPELMGEHEVEAFLSHLAVQGSVSASTQNQALSALLFLYRDVLQRELTHSIDAIRAQRPKRLPVVLSQEETIRVLEVMSGTPRLVAYLLYGSGLRLMECLRLRVRELGLHRQTKRSTRFPLIAMRTNSVFASTWLCSR